MKKSLAVFLSIVAYVVAYIPVLVFYFKPSLTLGLVETLNIPVYVALGISVFLLASLIAFYFRAYAVAVVISFIPVIIFIILGIIGGVLFLFYKDIAIAIVQEKIKNAMGLPLEGIDKLAKGIAKVPAGLFGK